MNTLDGLARLREALNFLCAYNRDQGYHLKFALEPKPNEPRGDIYLPVVGAMLGFIATLDHPEMVGLNPEFAHETMAGLNFVHAVAQAIDAGKLFHIDLNDQKMSRFDQDLRFGAENLKTAFFLVKLLEDSGYSGPRHFDAHALRTEDEAGVWEFAKGCMRTYLILKEKAAQFNADPEIQALLSAYKVRDGQLEPLCRDYTRDKANALKAHAFDLDALRARGPGLERLDQLTVELLLGVR
jgi:xylose isomerase